MGKTKEQLEMELAELRAKEAEEKQTDRLQNQIANLRKKQADRKFAGVFKVAKVLGSAAKSGMGLGMRLGEGVAKSPLASEYMHPQRRAKKHRMRE